jgi:hypothetical protein
LTVPARAVALCATALVLAAPAAAQVKLLYVPLDSGAAVRLFLTDGRRATGRLLAPFGPDSTRFFYCPGARGVCGAPPFAGPRTTAADQVVRVETRRGNRAVTGALIGTGAALGATAIACALVDGLGCDPADGTFVYAVLPAGLVGAGIGALIGGSIAVWAPAL